MTASFQAVAQPLLWLAETGIFLAELREIATLLDNAAYLGELRASADALLRA